MSPIYTKSGDKGETGLLDGSRVPKNHIRTEALGTVDEANAVLGVLVEAVDDGLLSLKLEKIQRRLFDINVVLADPTLNHTRPNEEDVKELEIAIDEMTDFLPELNQFILPGGSKAAALTHLARTVVRRAERRVITVSQNQEIPEVIGRYLNRLSDYLFTLARVLNYSTGKDDKLWKS
jgi:cob(I)alamin adenosyltransferase